mgnify:FL=1
MATETLTIARTSVNPLQELSDSFTVTDSSGALRYTVHYHLRLGTQEWQIHDANDAVIATLQRHVHVPPKFTIERPGAATVTIRKGDLMPIHQTWHIEGVEGGDVTVSGSFNDHEFVFTGADGSQVAEVSRRWMTMHEGLGIQLAGLDALVGSCAAIAIDSAENEGH